MTRSTFAFLLACLCATAMSTAAARGVERLSAADTGACSADLAAAKADAEDKQEAAPARASKPSSPVRSQPGVRGGDPAPVGTRLHAPRWHSFLPGMFR